MKTRYRFSHRANGRYYWESTRHLDGDSRVEQISANIDWFWNPR